MSNRLNVGFEEENNFSADRFVAASGELPMMVKLLLKIGVVKNEKQANYVLIGIAVCAVLLTIWVVRSSFGDGSSGLDTGTFRVGPPVGEL